MALSKTTLASGLEQVFNAKPSSPADAALAWANVYLAYAVAALSTAGSLPVTAPANLGILLGTFTGALQAQSGPSAAALMSQGVIAFWTATVWIGPVAAGMTAVPGNFALPASLSAIFVDLSKRTAKEKADQLADAFDVGARGVVVSDVPYIQPAPPIVGPIN